MKLSIKSARLIQKLTRLSLKSTSMKKLKRQNNSFLKTQIQKQWKKNDETDVMSVSSFIKNPKERYGGV